MLDNLKYGEVRFPRHTGSPAGPVVTYLLNPDELAEVIEKYGPPGKYLGEKRPFRVAEDFHTKRLQREAKGRDRVHLPQIGRNGIEAEA